ncbi:MAG: trypsin-like peptidase domain-containing protein [Myxococcaceae bacterium]|nr:trypsin-like peptidase domain-containing protein [Myxococcaceae bacterium]
MRLRLALVLLFVGCRPGPRPLTAAEVYARLSPSIAHLSTGLSGGSGVLLEKGLVLTNAHVVWPHDKVRVTFPPHLEFLDVPVRAIDVDSDLALVGPLPQPLNRTPLALVSPDSLSIGSEVFLIGYPGEVEKFPQPAITRGVLSRVREARFQNLTFLQSDATIVGGQSGGALVSSTGDVIGISGLIGIERFALALSATDVLARLPAIKTPPGPFTRSTGPADGGTRHSVTFDAAHARVAWYFAAQDGEQVRLESRNAVLDVFDSDLAPVEPIDLDTWRFDVSGPHVVVATVDGPSTAEVESDRELIPFRDPDDGRVVTIGEDLHGVIDFPTDEDRYVLPLEHGQRVYLRVDGVFDALCSVLDEEGDEELLAARVAEGGLGMSADLTFEAPSTGRFIVVVAESSPEGPAGYLLRVSFADKATRPTRRPVVIDGGTQRGKR